MQCRIRCLIRSFAIVLCNRSLCRCVRETEEAFEESQKYKEGKFILEKEKLIKEALA